jgi:hypothetical protein
MAQSCGTLTLSQDESSKFTAAALSGFPLVNFHPLLKSVQSPAKTPEAVINKAKLTG